MFWEWLASAALNGFSRACPQDDVSSTGQAPSDCVVGGVVAIRFLSFPSAVHQI